MPRECVEADNPSGRTSRFGMTLPLKVRGLKIMRLDVDPQTLALATDAELSKQTGQIPIVALGGH